MFHKIHNFCSRIYYYTVLESQIMKQMKYLLTESIRNILMVKIQTQMQDFSTEDGVLFKLL